jgi:hypothetical protein
MDTKSSHAVSKRTNNSAVLVEMGAADRPETWQYFGGVDAVARGCGNGGLVVAGGGKHGGGTDEGGESIEMHTGCLFILCSWIGMKLGRGSTCNHLA